jgi:hypothetical protein
MRRASHGLGPALASHDSPRSVRGPREKNWERSGHVQAERRTAARARSATAQRPVMRSGAVGWVAAVGACPRRGRTTPASRDSHGRFPSRLPPATPAAVEPLRQPSARAPAPTGPLRAAAHFRDCLAGREPLFAPAARGSVVGVCRPRDGVLRGKGEGDRAERVNAPSIGRRAVEAALDLSTERGMRRAAHQVGSCTARTALLRRGRERAGPAAAP